MCAARMRDVCEREHLPAYPVCVCSRVCTHVVDVVFLINFLFCCHYFSDNCDCVTVTVLATMTVTETV